MDMSRDERYTMAISPTSASRCCKTWDLGVAWEGCVVEREVMVLGTVDVLWCENDRVQNGNIESSKFLQCRIY